MRKARFARTLVACLVACVSSPLAGLVGGSVGEPSAAADVTHVVAQGHTMEAIAHRYHVTVKAIVEANHLKDADHLKVGEALKIPGAKDDGSGGAKTSAHATSYAVSPKTPGVVHATRLATSEDFTIHVSTRRGKQQAETDRTIQHMFRSAGGQERAIDPRLVALLGVVSNHFGSRRLEVISGYRPFSPTQYTAHSNHNVGRAVDFRVVGVPNEVVRDFCRTLKNTGCGYYPNSVFVHMDVRDSSAYWVDYSRPGEAPRYTNTAPGDADEGAGDVGEAAHVGPGDEDHDGMPEVEDVPPGTPYLK